MHLKQRAFVFFKNFYQLQVHDRYAWRAIFNGECLFLIRENFSPNFFSRSGKVSKSEMMRVLLKLDRIEENEDDDVSTDEDDDDTVDGSSVSKHRAVCSSDLNHYTRHTCSFLNYLDERVFWCLGQKLMFSSQPSADCPEVLFSMGFYARYFFLDVYS